MEYPIVTPPIGMFWIQWGNSSDAALPTLVIYVLFAEQFAEGLETGG